MFRVFAGGEFVRGFGSRDAALDFVIGAGLSEVEILDESDENT